MNNVLETIRKRRSVRAYKPEAVSEGELDMILEAGLWAPSARNDQPWHFTVVHDGAFIDKMSDVAKAEMRASGDDWLMSMGNNENFHLFYHAPIVIVVSGKKNAYSPQVDASAAIENMLIAAESLNIGTCWIGLIRHYFASPGGTESLGLPDGYAPLCAVCVGYKAKDDNGEGPARKGYPVRHLR